VVLGLVGACGIGFLLTNAMRLFEHQDVLKVLLFIFVIVEQTSSYIRERFIQVPGFEGC
jgi:ABC-type phosphate/phosphonate transport system permease subunit